MDNSNFYVLYNETNKTKIIILNELNNGINLLGKYNDILILLLTNENIKINNNNIIPIKLQNNVNIYYPNKTIAGYNKSINDYFDFCIENKNNQIYQNIYNELKPILINILKEHIIDIEKYINQYLSFHILYKYNTVDKIFVDYGFIPHDHMFIKNAYIKHNLTFDFNYKYNELYTDENKFWLELNGSKVNMEQIYNDRLKDKNGKIIKLNNRYIYINLTHAHGWYNFGEFLDAFQKLYIVEMLKLDKKMIKLILHGHNKVVDMHRYLYNLGYSNNNFITIDQYTTYIVDTCLFIPLLCYPARMLKHTHYWFTNLQLKNINYDNNINLYLNRNNYGSRQVINNDEILNLLKQYNFKVLEGTENLNEILYLFHNAKIIIGPHGSMFRNLIYCKPNTIIMEFCSENRLDYSFFELAQLSNIPYLHILSKSDENNNIYIDSSIIKNYLTKLL